MSLRNAAIDAHPGFPWLDPTDVSGIHRLLQQLDWLQGDERVVDVSKAGEGNMNLTLRVTTYRRSVVLKQARPWVEKYDHIAAPWDRILYEQGFYQRVRDIAEVASQMPKVETSDASARVLLLEDLPDAQDFTGVYQGERITREEFEALAHYLHALHEATRGGPDPEFENRAMRELNYEHIFVVPLAADNGLDLDAHEPGLQAAAESLKVDKPYCDHVEALGRRYLENGPCLLHGDYFPGSWLRTADGVRIIDPEFCFYGDPEFDVAVAVAHCALAGLPREDAQQFMHAYGASLDPALLAQYAAVEVMRRLIGVAQLPLPPTDGFRAALLERSRQCMLKRDVQALWP